MARKGHRFGQVFRRIMNRLRASAAEQAEPLPHLDSVLDGDHAVALIEACLAEAACNAESTLALDASWTFADQTANQRTNLFGAPLQAATAPSVKATLATASGFSLAGLRATAFVSGQELEDSQLQLARAVSRHLPLVVHLTNRASRGPGLGLHTGHEAYHAAAHSGAFQLMAINVQEAVDLTLLARRVAEDTLVPGLVAIDRDETARSAQEVRLPTRELLEAFLGRPGDSVPCPTPAQAAIFGQTRRRVPRYYDLERPVLAGPVYSGSAWSLAAAGQRPYFEAHVDEALERHRVALTQLTGRSIDALATYRVDDAQSLLILEGAAFESVCPVIDVLRAEYKISVGALAVRVLRPFPTAKLGSALRGKSWAIVLERAGHQLAPHPPLSNDLQSAISDTGPNGPQLTSAIYGLGPQPLQARDLIALCRRNHAEAPRVVHLGIGFARDVPDFPKRQTTMGQLRRAYAALDDLGLASPADEPQRSAESLSVAVGFCRPSSSQRRAADLAATVGEIVQKCRGGLLRTQLANDVHSAGVGTLDRFYQLATGDSRSAAFVNRCDDQALDLVVLDRAALNSDTSPWSALAPEGAILIDWGTKADRILPAALIQRVGAQRLRLFSSCAAADAEARPARSDRLVGASLGLLKRLGKLDVTNRRLLSARQGQLDGLTPERRGIRLAAFEAGFAGIRGPEPIDGFSVAPARDRDHVPFMVRALAPKADVQENVPYADLPHFWNQVGAFYDRGQTAQLSSDPLLSSGLIPPLSASFCDRSRDRAAFPSYNPARCTGCGKCWTFCPDAAIGVAVIGPKSLLEAGIKLAQDRGAKADALRPLLGKLAAQISRLVLTTTPEPPTVGHALEPSFGELLSKSSYSAERVEALRAALAEVLADLGHLPLCKTDVFFESPEREKGGSGELLSLAIDPRGCTGCGLCVKVCSAEALTMLEGQPDQLAPLEQRWETLQRLPDAAPATVERARDHADVGPLAATMLARANTLDLVAGGGTESGSAAMITLRAVLALTEAHQRQKQRQQLAEIDRLRDELSKRIRDTLAAALPANDVDALAVGLETLGRGRATLAELAARIEGVVESKQVDVVRLQRLVDVARRIADLSFDLGQRCDGLGRARLGLVLRPDQLTSGLCSFPNNAFRIPVVFDGSFETASLAHGMISGQTQRLVSDFRLLREAQLELDNPTEAALSSPALESLRFDDLTPEQRELCPPLWVVADEAAFDDRSLVPLLNGSAPVKILLLADPGRSLRESFADRDELALLALGSDNVIVAQTSFASPEHLARSLRAVLNHSGPALVRAYAPSPSGEGLDPRLVLDHARLAIETRVFPLFVLDPAASGVFGQRLDLDKNPDPETTWVKGDGGTTLGPEQWLADQGRFADLLASAGVAPEGSHTTLGVTRFKRARERSWQLLQELAGVITPFTAKVKEQAEQAVGQAHQAALAALRGEYEQRLATLEAQHTLQIAHRLRDQLLSFTGFDRGSSKA
jgi:pyruvate-ferredoxin/flavodoxin oxidoreductase